MANKEAKDSTPKTLHSVINSNVLLPSEYADKVMNELVENF